MQFESAVYMSHRLIGEKDTSILDTVEYIGWTYVNLYDRRILEYTLADVAIYRAFWNNGDSTEIHVHKDLTDQYSLEQILHLHALPFAYKMGQLPAFMLKGINRLVLIPGNERWGAKEGSIYIHLDLLANEDSDYVEELLLHEGGHAAMDRLYAKNPNWLKAQEKDSLSLSKYGEENIATEDLTESIIFWLAIRHRNKRIYDSDSTTIAESIPNRLSFLDSLNLDVFPLDQPNKFDVLYEVEEDEYENWMTFEEFVNQVKFFSFIVLLLIVIVVLYRYIDRLT